MKATREQVRQLLANAVAEAFEEKADYETLNDGGWTDGARYTDKQVRWVREWLAREGAAFYREILADDELLSEIPE